MGIKWREPLDWNRVKRNARAIARMNHWWLLCGGTAVVLFAGCLGLRILHPSYAELLTGPVIAVVSCVGMIVFPLSLFVYALRTGSVRFRRKAVDLCDFSVYVSIQYERISSIGFARFDGKTYLIVRGLPQGRAKDVEVCVAMTEKYSMGDITDYLILSGLGNVFKGTQDVSVSPVRSDRLPTTEELSQGILGDYCSLTFLGSFFFVFVCGGRHDWSTIIVVYAWVAEMFAWRKLLCLGAGCKFDELGVGLTARQVLVIGVPYALALIFNPALVSGVLWWSSLDTASIGTICCLTAVWQLVWTVAVYSTGRLFRRENT